MTPKILVKIYTFFVYIQKYPYLCIEQISDMEVYFEKEYLSDLYYKGKTTDKKYRFQPEVIKRYKLRIETLESAASIEDLYQINSLHYEVLKGDKRGISSIRVNDQYRIEFTTNKIESETVVIVCNILELSKHYK